MITIRDVEIDFDITAPADLQRLNTAQKAAAEKEAALRAPAQNGEDADYLEKYIAWLNGILHVFGNFMDEAFGEGVAEKLLTARPSLTKMLDVNDALAEAMGTHTQRVTERFAKYKPSRARRKQG